MYALGGTALTILNIKNSTLDVDINIATDKEYKDIIRLFEQIGFEKIGLIRWITQDGLAFDIFKESYILGTGLLPDCLKRSKYIRTFNNIELYTLSLEDIIISKLARGDLRDFDDIRQIFEKTEMNLSYLVKRYKDTMKISVVFNYKQKLLDLISIKFKEWNFIINKELIDEVNKWEQT